ncbi:MAG: 4-hydroxy-tetrahydrodipicolinate synthase [Alphaproteobacteria bacterium]|nr:4-hydroxy-tetrahydrodipicolinate synthase [Alphaproteobacteria bacterium]
MIQGLYTALITPFKNGKVDEAAFQSFVEWQIAEGVHGLVPCGTTGESPTLTHEEHNRVIDMTIEVAKARVKVMAGTGSNSTDEAIMTTRHAKKSGADSALVVAPYYNKPTQEGLFQHFKAIHDAVDIPIIIYNIPGRSTVNIFDDTLARLSALPNIAGIKDATGDLARVHTLRARLSILSHRERSGASLGEGPHPTPLPEGEGKYFSLLSGEDMTAVAFNAIGGQGCISVSSNIMPKACAEVQNASLAGDVKKALALQDKLVPLHEVMFCETSPAPVKYAASLIKKCSADMRLPMVPPSEANKKAIQQILSNLGLL